MGGPFGPGHASFVPSPQNDGRVFCVYHGTEREDEGWRNRKGRIMALEGHCFDSGSGRTMCCAYSVCGPVDDTHGVFPSQPNASQYQAQQAQGQYPGQQQPNASQYPAQQAQAASNSSGGLASKQNINKYLDQAQKVVPAQYQGYFNKARKLFK